MQQFNVPIRVPCIDRNKLPVRPRTAMPEDSADIARHGYGAYADVEQLNKYADALEAAQVGCYKVEQKRDVN